MLHKYHRISAGFIGIFVFFHLINHLCILNGVQQHIEFMKAFRHFYRNPIGESILLMSVLFQVCSGVYLVWSRRGRRVGFLEKAQAISGLYLAYFLINHVVAVLIGRFGAELDTNIYFGIAGFYTKLFQFYFVPYYFFAVVALFVHIAVAFNYISRKSIVQRVRLKLSYLIILIGVMISGVLILGFYGVFNDISIPQQYRATYE